jgi:hypothetical protein
MNLEIKNIYARTKKTCHLKKQRKTSLEMKTYLSKKQAEKERKKKLSMEEVLFWSQKQDFMII